ncbi:MAG: AAA family ATPase [Janthinobacterium lividum]|nr:AAA family ATPase [Janthinobacterium lividum]
MITNKKYIYVTGGKGGIGKSTFTLALVDYMAQQGKVLLIDADPVNADSSAAYKEGKETNVRAIRAKVRAEDTSGQIDASGLIETLNMADKDEAITTIVDAPAGDSTLLISAGSIITEACKQVGMESIFVWLVDSTDRTPVNALHGAWEAIKDANKILIVKNYRKGTNFDFFDNSKTIANINEAKNVQTIDLPKIASRLEEHMRIDRMTWKEIATDTPIGNRVEGQRIRKAMHDTLKEVGL